MTNNKIALLQIGVALFFAAAILLSSYLLGGTQYEHNSDTVTFFIIAIWFIPFSFLAKEANKNAKANKTC